MWDLPSKASTAQEVTIQSLGKTIKNEHIFLQKTTQQSFPAPSLRQISWTRDRERGLHISAIDIDNMRRLVLHIVRLCSQLLYNHD